jgi:Domain of unknown function (DUF1648)
MATPQDPTVSSSNGTLKLLAWSGFWLGMSALLYLLAAANLPSEVAIHWNGSGVADGSAPRWAILAVAAGVAVVGLLLSLQFRVGSEPAMEAFAIVGMLGALGFAITLIAVISNWGVDEWTEASSLSVWFIVGILVFPLLGLFVGIVLGRALYPIKDLGKPSDEDRPSTKLSIGERVSWVGRARVKWMAMAFVAIAVSLLFVFPGLPLWVFLAIAGIGVVFSQVEANVTNDGLRVRLGGIPVRKIDIDEISSARSFDLEPMDWGGWGYRVSPGRTAIVLRRGEALEVTFKNGRRFAMTVDDSRAGAALLNGLADLGAESG